MVHWDSYFPNVTYNYICVCMDTHTHLWGGKYIYPDHSPMEMLRCAVSAPSPWIWELVWLLQPVWLKQCSAATGARQQKGYSFTAFTWRPIPLSQFTCFGSPEPTHRMPGFPEASKLERLHGEIAQRYTGVWGTPDVAAPNPWTALDDAKESRDQMSLMSTAPSPDS